MSVTRLFSMGSMANAFSLCWVMVLQRKWRSTSQLLAVVVGVVMRMLKKGTVSKKTPCRLFFTNSCNRPGGTPVGFELHCYAALGWPSVCSSAQHQETRSDSAQTCNPAARWPWQDGLRRKKSTPWCSLMCYKPGVGGVGVGLSRCTFRLFPPKVSTSKTSTFNHQWHVVVCHKQTNRLGKLASVAVALWGGGAEDLDQTVGYHGEHIPTPLP